MVTDRDNKLLAVLHELRYITVRLAVPHIYPSEAIARRRLQNLSSSKLVSRHATGLGPQALYSLPEARRPVMVEHMLGILDLWHRLANSSQLVSFRPEVTLEGLRPDAIIIWRQGSQEAVYCYEYERTNEPSSIAHKVHAYEAWVKTGGWKRLECVPEVLVETKRVSEVERAIARSQTLHEMRWIVCEDVSGILLGGSRTVNASTSISWSKQAHKQYVESR